MTSQGESFDEARANLAEALELYFDDDPDMAAIEPLPGMVPLTASVATGAV